MRMSSSLAVTYGAALVGAGAWGLALGYGAWPLAWGAFLPLWGAWHHVRVSPSQVLTHAVGPSLLAYGGAFLIAYPWVGSHVTDSGIQAGFSAMLILALLYSLPLVAGARACLQGQRSGGMATWIGGWMLVDLLLQYGSWAFPWALGAHAIVDSPGTYMLVRLGGPVAGTAAIGGMHVGLLTALRTMASHQTSSHQTSQDIGRKRMRTGAVGLLLISLGLFVALQGVSQPVSSPSLSSRAPTTAWVVQPNADPAAWADADNPARKARLLALTQAALDTTSTRPHLVVWPETALHTPDTMGMQAAVDRWEVAVLAGAVLPARTSSAQTTRGDSVQAYSAATHWAQTNSALLYRPHRPVQRYDKHHLVPFAESVPGASVWRELRRFTMASAAQRAYVPGPGPTAFLDDTLSFVPLICFESLAAPLVARLGADLHQTRALITVAQTGWWRHTLPAQQHVQYSRLRAMETGRPLLIASVSGPTTLVAPSGTPTVLAPFGDATVAPVRWPAAHPPGWYMRTAPYTDIAWTAVALLLVSVPTHLMSRSLS